jgi:hypothetical protein
LAAPVVVESLTRLLTLLFDSRSSFAELSTLDV